MKGILLPSTGPGCNELGNYSCSSRKQGRLSVPIGRFQSKLLIRCGLERFLSCPKSFSDFDSSQGQALGQEWGI